MRASTLKSLETVGALILGAGTVVSAILFVGSVNDKANANAERIDRQKEKIVRMENSQEGEYREIHQVLIDIRERVTRIEQYQKDKE